jgi:hypothetical protein
MTHTITADTRALFRARSVAHAALLILGLVSSASGQMADRYARSERLLAWHVDPLITGDQVRPQWKHAGSALRPLSAGSRNVTGWGHQLYAQQTSLQHIRVRE